MASSRKGGREDQACAQASKNTEAQEEVPVLRAQPKEEIGQTEQDAASKNQELRPMCIENGSDLQPTEECEEDVHGENP